jgi:hypothetical protein
MSSVKGPAMKEIKPDYLRLSGDPKQAPRVRRGEIVRKQPEE